MGTSCAGNEESQRGEISRLFDKIGSPAGTENGHPLKKQGSKPNGIKHNKNAT
jgi:hypothetical protein